MKPILPIVSVLLLGLVFTMRGLVPQSSASTWDSHEFSAALANGKWPVEYCPPGDGRVEEIRVILPNEWGVPYPAGLSYSLARDQIALLAENGITTPSGDGSTIVVITPYEDLVGSVNLAFPVENPINIAYDDGDERLFLLDDVRAELDRVAVREDGLPVPDTLTHFDIGHLGLDKANGIAVDAEGRHLLILDSGASQIVSADIDGEFELISKVDLTHLADLELSSIAIHPTSQNLFVVSAAEEIMYELAKTGALVNSYDLAALDLVDVRGIGFGHSADLTDDPDTVHLFMADSNRPDDESVTKETMFGKILEIAIHPGCEDRCQFK